MEQGIDAVGREAIYDRLKQNLATITERGTDIRVAGDGVGCFTFDEAMHHAFTGIVDILYRRMGAQDETGQQHSIKAECRFVVETGQAIHITAEIDQSPWNSLPVSWASLLGGLPKQDEGGVITTDSGLQDSRPVPLREKLSALAHDQWTGWMMYLMSKCTANADGSMTIPKPLVDRWQHQMITAYNGLSDAEKDSDRVEADRVIGACVATGGALMVERAEKEEARRFVNEWVEAALFHYPKNWAFDPTNPKGVIANILRASPDAEQSSAANVSPEAGTATDLQEAAKVGIESAMLELGVNNADLARRLNTSRAAITQMFSEGWTLARFQKVVEALGATVAFKLNLPTEQNESAGGQEGTREQGQVKGDKPRPGTLEAQELGCICPTAPSPEDEISSGTWRATWFNKKCPLHKLHPINLPKSSPVKP